MKTVFINLSLRPGSKRKQLPVGLGYIMTAAKKAGVEFDLIDMDVVDMTFAELEEVLEKTIYDVYAFGCIVTGFVQARKASEIIKRINPNAIIIAGNSVATSIPEILLKNTKVDIAALGEGDVTIVDLLAAISKKQDWRSVAGIAFEDNGEIRFSEQRVIIPDLDPIGFPDWEIFDLEKYNVFGKINFNMYDTDAVLGYPLNSARGCPFNCTFCYHVFHDQKYRSYSACAITQEIKRLHNKYGAGYISFWDELTFPNIKGVRELLEQLSGLDFKVGWGAPCRANIFKKDHVETIKEMSALGCDNISYSLENASPEILKAMKKHITVDEFIEQSNALWKGGVTPLTSVIFGYPQETPETIQMTIDVCDKCDIFPSVGFLLPLPGTPIYEWAKESGHITDEIHFLENIGDRQDFHINLTQMSNTELVDTVSEKLTALAKKQGLNVESVFKTTTYQQPKNRNLSADDEG